MQKTQGIDIYNFIYFCPELQGRYCQGNVGDSIPDKKSPCHEQVCTLVTKKAAAWVKFPDL